MEGYNFPWSNMHELNLDWLLREIKNISITQQDVEDIRDMYAQFSPYLFPTVKTYGAIGDGVTDDTQAIIDCMNNESIVIFPPGTYKIDSMMHFISVSDRLLVGWPHATLDVSEFRPGFSYCENIIIDNLTFIGSHNSNEISTLTFYYCDNITVKNCKSFYGRSIGFQFSCCGNVFVENCEVAYTLDHCGISFSTDAAAENGKYGYLSSRYVTNCFCHHNGLDGIIADAHNVTVSNCILNDNGTDHNAGGLYQQNHSHLRVTNTVCNRNSGSGIDIDNSYDVRANNCVLIGNLSAGVLYCAVGVGSIRDCFCSDNGASPQFDGHQYQEGGIVLTQKTVNGVTITCDRIAISGCALNNNTEYGIRTYNTPNLKIDELEARDNGTGNMYLEGYWEKADYTPTFTPMT